MRRYVTVTECGLRDKQSEVLGGGVSSHAAPRVLSTQRGCQPFVGAGIVAAIDGGPVFRYAAEDGRALGRLAVPEGIMMRGILARSATVWSKMPAAVGVEAMV